LAQLLGHLLDGGIQILVRGKDQQAPERGALGLEVLGRCLKRALECRDRVAGEQVAVAFVDGSDGKFGLLAGIIEVLLLHQGPVEIGVILSVPF
jgi:hypothetical protein